jgi:hypothetical protein
MGAFAGRPRANWLKLKDPKARSAMCPRCFIGFDECLALIFAADVRGDVALHRALFADLRTS